MSPEEFSNPAAGPTQPSFAVHDPPPPYPSSERRSRAARYHRRHRLPASLDSDPPAGSTSPHSLAQTHSLSHAEDVTEQTPLLSESLPESTRRPSYRPRSYSQSSTIISSASYAPSLAQTVLSLLQSDPADESDMDIYEALAGHREDPCHIHDGRQAHHQLSVPPVQLHSGRWPLFSRHWWSRYFRPVTRGAYHAAVFHLLVLNFPYALIAWIYLFVFTLVSVGSLNFFSPRF